MGIRLVIQSRWTAEPSPDFVYEFDQGRVSIGRARSADICIPHPAVSAAHATISEHNAGYGIEDEESTNGTKVNGQRIAPRRKKTLKNGDEIEIGGFRLTFRGGVAVSHVTSSEDTRTLAHQMVRYAVGQESTGIIDRPRLRVIAGPDRGAAAKLPEPPSETIVGRAEESQLPLTDPDASREHLRIRCDLGGAHVSDLGSKNGLLLNDKRLGEGEHKLRDGDELCLGVTVLRFEEPATKALALLLESPDIKAEPAEPEQTVPIETEGGTENAKALSTPAQAEKKARQSSHQVQRGADLLIYLMAAAVLALSVAALFVLLRAT